MTASEMASHFRARGRSNGPWMAKCPAHRDRTASLSIRPGKDRTNLKCFAGCDSDDVLAAVGLTWRDCYYEPRAKLDAKAQAEARRKRDAEELRARNLRIGEWILRHIERGYTRQDRDADITAIVACAIVLSNRPNPTWESIFKTHWESIAAADHCRLRRMLPQ